MALPQQFLGHPFSMAKPIIFLLPLLYVHFRNSLYLLFVPHPLPWGNASLTHTQVATVTYSAIFTVNNVGSLKGLFSPTPFFLLLNIFVSFTEVQFM